MTPPPGKRPFSPEVAAILARRLPAAWRPASLAEPQAPPVLRLIEAPLCPGEPPLPPVFAWLRRLAWEDAAPLAVERGGLERLAAGPADSAEAPSREVFLLHPTPRSAEALFAALLRRRNAQGASIAGQEKPCFVLLPRSLGTTSPLWREAGAVDVFVSPRRLPEVVRSARRLFPPS